MTPPSVDAALRGGHSYEVFGLGLASYLSLPGLRAATDEGVPQISIRRGRVRDPGAYPRTGIAAWEEPSADGIAWYGRGRLRISEAVIDVDGTDERFLRQCLVGPGLGVLMHRRGHLVLHGSAVDVGGRAVILLGQKGAGKSTTAGELLRRGHRLLTDDLVVLREDRAGSWTVLPGPTQMKLWPASAAALEIAGELVPFMDGLDKGVWHGASTARAAVPIGTLCALAWGETLSTAPLDGSRAFGAIFDHVYAPRFLGARAGAELVGPTARCAAAAGPVRLARPRALEWLTAVGDEIERLAE